MKQVTFIYFDIGGVLVDHIAAWTRLATILQIEPNILISEFKKRANDLDRGTLKSEEFEQTMRKILKISKNLPMTFVDFFANNFIPIEATQNFVREIHPQVGIGLLSNVSLDVFDIVQAKKAIPDIEYQAIIKSAAVGYIKPEKEIYDLALAEIGRDPSAVLFIDDSEINVDAAQKFGWHAVLFDTHDPEKSIQKIREQFSW